jgi:hypothetical protein
MTLTRTIVTTVLVLGASCAGGYAGAYLFHERSGGTIPADSTYLGQGKIVSIDTEERNVVVTLGASEKQKTLELYLTPDTRFARRQFVREEGIIRGITDMPVQFMESLIPGELVEVMYRINTRHRRLEALRIITGEFLP